jgi:hypothetical protein
VLGVYVLLEQFVAPELDVDGPQSRLFAVEEDAIGVEADGAPGDLAHHVSPGPLPENVESDDPPRCVRDQSGRIGSSTPGPSATAR